MEWTYYDTLGFVSAFILKDSDNIAAALIAYVVDGPNDQYEAHAIVVH